MDAECSDGCAAAQRTPLTTTGQNRSVHSRESQEGLPELRAELPGYILLS